MERQRKYNDIDTSPDSSQLHRESQTSNVSDIFVLMRSMGVYTSKTRTLLSLITTENPKSDERLLAVPSSCHQMIVKSSRIKIDQRSSKGIKKEPVQRGRRQLALAILAFV